MASIGQKDVRTKISTILFSYVDLGIYLVVLHFVRVLKMGFSGTYSESAEKSETQVLGIYTEGSVHFWSVFSILKCRVALVIYLLQISPCMPFKTQISYYISFFVLPYSYYFF